jgi:hypothetical protein
MQTVASLIALVGIVVAVYGAMQWRKLKKQGGDTKKAKWLIPGGVVLIIIGGALITTTPEYKADMDADKASSQSSKKASSASSKKTKDAAKNSSKAASSKLAASISKAVKRDKEADKKKSDALQAKVDAIYKDLGGDEEYPLTARIEVNGSSDHITGVSVWADGSLANADTATLKHYFALGAQVGNRLLGGDTYKVPYVQVYAEQTKIARSQITNTSQMKDLR